MTPTLVAGLGVLMLGTAFLSGIFGMAGGLVLIGVLLALLPVPEAMALHAITQMTSNGWRAVLWVKHVKWRILAGYSVGALVAIGLWSIWLYVPERPIAMIALGLSPHLLRLFPPGFRPDPERHADAAGFGLFCVSLMMLTGSSGPVLDAFFLGGRLDRRQIVATKAAAQLLGHLLKLIYFAGLIDQAATVEPLIAGIAVGASVVGTTLARAVLERMSDAVFRAWVGRLVLVLSAYYVVHGTWLLLFG